MLVMTARPNSGDAVAPLATQEIGDRPSVVAEVALIPYRGADEILRRHQQFSEEVAQGRRSAHSLILIPKSMAQNSKVTYPVAPFGEPEPW